MKKANAKGEVSMKKAMSFPTSPKVTVRKSVMERIAALSEKRAKKTSRKSK